jgi:hypothetical protein
MSRFSSRADLEEARQDYEEAFLSQRANILRSEPGEPDGYGGRVNTLKTVARQVPAKLERPGPSQRTEEGQQNTALGDKEILLPMSVDVVLGDLIEIAGTTYEVRSSDAGNEEALVLRVFCVSKK